jgi:hypothetical protein
MWGKKKGKKTEAEAPPPGSPPAAAGPASPDTDLSKALTAFYEKHAPAKVKNVSNLLTHIENGDLSVQELNQLLLDEYGEGFVDAPPSEAPLAEETRPAAELPPARVPPEAVPPTGPSVPNYNQLLTAFYKTHAPSKLDEPGKVGKVLEGFGDNIDDLNAALKDQYGQDLTDFVPSATPAVLTPASPEEDDDDDGAAADDDDDEISKLRAKLYVFYNQHAPDKVGNVEKLAEQFAGEEDKLNESLMEVS